MITPRKLYRQARNLYRKRIRNYEIDKDIIDIKADHFPVLNTAMNIIEDTARAEDTDKYLNGFRLTLLKSYFENEHLKKYLEAVIRRDIVAARDARERILDLRLKAGAREKARDTALKMSRQTRDIRSLYYFLTNEHFNYVPKPNERLSNVEDIMYFQARPAAAAAGCKAIDVMKELLREKLQGRPEAEILIDNKFKDYELGNKYPDCTAHTNKPPPADDGDDGPVADGAADGADGYDGDDDPAAAADGAADGDMRSIPIEFDGGRKSRTRKSKIQHKKSHKKNSKKHHKKSKKHPKRKNKKTYRKY